MILKLSLLLVLAPSLKREVFLRLPLFFILLRNQYVLIQIRCRILDVGSRFECATSFLFYLFQLVLANGKFFFFLWQTFF